MNEPETDEIEQLGVMQRQLNDERAAMSPAERGREAIAALAMMEGQQYLFEPGRGYPARVTGGVINFIATPERVFPDWLGAMSWRWPDRAIRTRPYDWSFDPC